MTRVATRLALALALAVCGCASIPQPHSALDASDLAEVERMLELWSRHGLPDPTSRCDMDSMIVLWPALAETVYGLCKRKACRTPPQPGCADECFVMLYDGFLLLEAIAGGRTPVAVVSARIDRRAWRHAWGHYAERCAGLPMSHMQGDDPAQVERFEAWLADVESRSELD